MSAELRDRVETVLRTHAASALHLDPLGIEVLDVAGGIASVRLSGACASCPGGIHVLITGLEQELRQHLPEVEFLEVVL